MMKKVAWFLFSATLLISIFVVGPAGASNQPAGALNQPAGALNQEEQARQIGVPVPGVVSPGPGRFCTSLGFKPVEVMHELDDNFTSPTPGNPSDDLSKFLADKLIGAFDDPRENAHFGDSFRLEGCKVCYGELKISLRAGAGKSEPWNDSLHVGVAPFQISSQAGVNLFGQRIWSNSATPVSVTGTKVMTVPLTGSQLNGLITSGKMLDVYVQDDTVVNYITLTLWK